MKLLLATDNRNSTSALMEAACTSGWQVISPSIPLERIIQEVATLRPDARVVLLTAHDTPVAIGKAIRAGVNACVAGRSEPGRIGHLLKIARVRFTEADTMGTNWKATKTLLAEHKRIGEIAPDYRYG